MNKLQKLAWAFSLPVLLTCAGSAYAVTVTPLTPAPTSASLTYQKPSTSSSVAVKVTSVNSTFFTVDPSTVPIWLSLDAMNGTANTTGVTINFSSSAVSATLGAGTYTASVHMQVTSGAQDLVVPVTLVIKNVAAVLSTAQSITQNITWSIGSAFPTASITPLSNADPIAYTAAAAVTSPSSPANWMTINHASGLAYSVGSTPVNVTFLPQVFQLATAGESLVSTLTLTPTSGSAVIVTFTITVAPPAAAITSLYPAQTPVQASAVSGDFLQVVISGTGFVAAPTAQATVVTIGGDIVGCASCNAATATQTVVNSNTIIVQIPADLYLTAATTLAITAQNPNPSGSPVAASSVNLPVTTAPIIYSIVNSGSYINKAAGPTLVPYEVISIFGDNFGADPVTPTLGSLDSTSRYSNSLTAGGHAIQVTFYRQDGTTSISNAYILFATQSQINCLVPAGVTASGITGLKVSVTYNAVESAKYSANVGTADPGLFTVASSGVGQAAVLLADGSVNSATNKVAKGATISFYLTGLGAPNSTATNVTATGAATYPAGCISTSAYMGTMNAAPISASPAWTSIDGAVLAAANITAGHFAPCFLTSGTGVIPVTAQIDGKTATVTYAGFVADSVAGLYQVNAVVPSTATSGTAISAVISVGTAVSQSGVTIAIQ
jgi:trimeric autotransporter adhesin